MCTCAGEGEIVGGPNRVAVARAQSQMTTIVKVFVRFWWTEWPRTRRKVYSLTSLTPRSKRPQYKATNMGVCHHCQISMYKYRTSLWHRYVGVFNCYCFVSWSLHLITTPVIFSPMKLLSCHGNKAVVGVWECRREPWAWSSWWVWWWVELMFRVWSVLECGGDGCDNDEIGMVC